jgi:hypothetical protein
MATDFFSQMRSRLGTDAAEDDAGTADSDNDKSDD